MLIAGCAGLLFGPTVWANGEPTPAPHARHVAGLADGNELTIAADGVTEAVIVVAPAAGERVTTGEGRQARTTVIREWERRAADDLAHYIELMTGARPAIADTEEALAGALAGTAPLLLVGEAALEANPELRRVLADTAKKDYTLRPDAIVLRREGNRVYLAGMDPPQEHAQRHVLKGEGHYFAVARLLHLWGCRWYLPTEFGEVVPEHERLAVGSLDFAYAPPFEIRMGAAGYAWLGDTTGRGEFMRRNLMNEVRVPCGHSLGRYVHDLIPEDGSVRDISLSVPETLAHVADIVDADFGAGRDIDMGMWDGAINAESPADAGLVANLYDKYFQVPVVTDLMMNFYNEVSRRLLNRHPDSDSRIGFFAYVNMTVPPQRRIKAESPLVAYLAPIDIDPNHGMDDPRSPPKQEYRDMMYRWSEVMDGRVAIYDYDQGMLVWRDLPNPSHQAFRQDVKHYRDAGILGFHTETRGAFAVIFLNLFVRGQLMWDPDADVDAMLAEFYPKFYGPAAEPMERYWSAIYRAWEDTITTEHEFFAIPAIYTGELVEELRGHLAAGIDAVAGWRAQDPETLSRRESLVLDRMTFTEHSFGMIEHYVAMLRAGATDGNYAEAAAAADRLLAARQGLIDLGKKWSEQNQGIFVNTRMGVEGAPWLLGEIEQYRDLLALTDGTDGELIARLPQEWAYRRDPNDTGLPRGFAYQPADLTYWNANKERYATPDTRKDYPITEWEMVRSDIYPQAQGVLHPDWQAFTGFMWYKTDVTLTEDQVAGPVRVHFPGLFSEAWLYVNGWLAAYREQNHMAWHNDYRFEWDVDLTEHLQPGENDITLRVHTTWHVGGLFRRPFLYRPVTKD